MVMNEFAMVFQFYIIHFNHFKDYGIYENISLFFIGHICCIDESCFEIKIKPKEKLEVTFSLVLFYANSGLFSLCSTSSNLIYDMHLKANWDTTSIISQISHQTHPNQLIKLCRITLGRCVTKVKTKLWRAGRPPAAGLRFKATHRGINLWNK